METGDYPKNDFVLEKGGLENVCPWSKKKDMSESPHVHEE